VKFRFLVLAIIGKNPPVETYSIVRLYSATGTGQTNTPHPSRAEKKKNQ
jgi:hypothetical protein